MKKILLAAIMFTSVASAKTFTCNDYTLYQGTGDNHYQKVQPTKQPSLSFTIISTEPMIQVNINGTHEPVEFWKDYNVYRNDTGLISQSGSEFTMKTSVKNNNGVYFPVKIVYHCK